MAEPGRIIEAVESLRIPQGAHAGEPVRLAQFQRQFIEGAFADGVNIGALSVGRGNGKTMLAAGLAVTHLLGEVQRHLAGWTLQPMAALMAEELEEKLGAPVKIDVMRATQAYDVSAKARAVSTYLEALATARQNGLLPGEVQEALSRVAWED